MRASLKTLFIAFFFSSAVCADDFDDETRRMLELSNTLQPMTQVMDQLLAAQAPLMAQQMYQGMRNEGKDVTQEDVSQLVADFREQMVSQFSVQIVPIVIDEYRKHFTLEEMIALNELISKPAFQAFAAKTPALMQASQQAGQELGQKIGAEVMQRLIALNPKFQ